MKKVFSALLVILFTLGLVSITEAAKKKIRIKRTVRIGHYYSSPVPFPVVDRRTGKVKVNWVRWHLKTKVSIDKYCHKGMIVYDRREYLNSDKPRKANAAEQKIVRHCAYGTPAYCYTRRGALTRKCRP